MVVGVSRRRWPLEPPRCIMRDSNISTCFCETGFESKREMRATCAWEAFVVGWESDLPMQVNNPDSLEHWQTPRFSVNRVLFSDSLA